jgi:hypothetical protein
LTDILNRPELRQFKQRVSGQCKLLPLSFDELREYINHRITQAGLPHQTLFSDPVMRRVYEYSEGIPRLVNSLCDASLQTGFAAHAPQITIAIVDEVAKDLDLKGSLPNGFKPSESLNTVAVPASTPVRHSNGHPELEKNGNGHQAAATAASSWVPLESYTERQKSLSFFAELMDRWK